MEEDIKILEELEEFMKEELRAEHSIFSIEQLQAIQNLISRYKELEEGKALTKKQEAMILKAIKQSAEEQITKEMKNYIQKSKVQEKIDSKFKESKGLYERGVQPQAQFTMKLLRDLEKELLEE